MKKLNKKGFTLIELMIVLAIIVILAVVLVPKAGQMKDSAGNAGVTTNVNAVRGTLEAKVVDITYLGNRASTLALLTSTFNGTLANPFNVKNNNVYQPNAAVNTNGTGFSIVVWDNASISVANFDADLATYAPVGGSVNKGIVFVYVYSDGYGVFGVDSTNTVVDKATIK